jgi:hypothetical protein
MLAHWRTTLEGLARRFAAGDARVDPKDAGACRHCPLPTLCRVGEAAAPALSDPGEDDDA